jgi:hypothetical protein
MLSCYFLVLMMAALYSVALCGMPAHLLVLLVVAKRGCR